MKSKLAAGENGGLARRSLLQAMGGGAIAGGLFAGGEAAATVAKGKDHSVLDVAIIGAGLSGLTSGRDLKRAGCESFVILEARDRVGGRTVNHDIGNGVISEGGGQWIGPGQTAVADLARELGVATFDSFYKGKTVYLVGDQRIEAGSGNGGLGAASPVIDKLNAMAREVPSAEPWNAPRAAKLDRQSLADWLAKEKLTDDDRLTFFLSATLTYGAPPEQLSLLHYLAIINSSDCNLEKLESMPGGAQEKRLVGGSYMLSARMAEDLKDKIRLSSPVRKIVGWDRNVVELHTDRGIIRTRQVIVAMSQSLCNQIAFDPPLPADRAAMHKAWPTTAHMRKTVHVYPRPFWRDAGLSGQVIQVGGPVLWCTDNSPSDLSVGIITAFVKEGALSADPNVAQRELSAIYARALGEKARNPTQYHEIDWSKVDRWSLSCTSPYAPGFLTTFGKAMRMPTGRLIWSGTDMAELWPSSMDGAIRAGHRSTLKALEALARS
ncbi:FAD-dependent oxidoreductase [Sphingomonas sp. MMSM20]|uniref:flavin monoamine oxidase family protein n=1 Tax=Sphingomonas lycopersici TaxID=2951807 RepID=UPI0022378EE4|nr:FAD-dependent oxidoreductase [Sphingomonas lycopersici]MCW6530395.1 FAD-dependent oxidoreductase [Sphingomonas lycopersici]